MNYHLHSQGQNLGLFSEDELRRRREAGELTGTEFVWRESMPDWQPLDAMLAGGGEPVSSSPPALPEHKTRRAIGPSAIWALVAYLALAAVVVTSITMLVIRGRKTLQKIQQTASAGVADDREGMEAASKPVTWSTNGVTESNLNAPNTRRIRSLWQRPPLPTSCGPSRRGRRLSTGRL